MKYNVKWYLKGSREENEIQNLSLGEAVDLGKSKAAVSAVVTVGAACELSDVSAGRCHADNVGKYFLHQIIK